MASRPFDIVLDCGCIFSSASGNWSIVCCHGHGCGEAGCEEGDLCKNCINRIEICEKAFNKFIRSKEYKEYRKLRKKKKREALLKDIKILEKDG
jgi:hypothetical protein